MPNAKLAISGTVEKFVTISPRMVRLTGNMGQPIQSTVKIIPQKKYPFSILSVKAKNGKNISYSLDKINSHKAPYKNDKNKNGKKEYLLHVKNIKNTAGMYRDFIILKTDSKIQPEIPIMVFARIINPNVHPKVQHMKPGSGKTNPFMEMIKKMQREKALKQGKASPASGNSVKDQEMKKKFEDLLKQSLKNKNK